MVLSIWCLWYLLYLPAYSYYFTNPQPEGDSANLVYTIGDDINIQWASQTGESNFLDMVMWQDGTDTQNVVFTNVSGLWEYKWTIFLDPTQNLSITNQFYFSLYISGGTDPISSSHDFNLTEPVTTSTSISSTVQPTSTIVSPTVRPPSTTTTASTTSTPSATNDSQPSGGLSTGAKAGIGVGVPIAVILGVAAGFMFARWNKKNDAPASSPQVVQGPSYQYQPSYTQVPREELADTSATGPSEPSEMPTEPDRPISYK